MKITKKGIICKIITFGSSLAWVFGLFGPSILGFIACCLIDATVSIEIKIMMRNV